MPSGSELKITTMVRHRLVISATLTTVEDPVVTTEERHSSRFDESVIGALISVKVT